jgi:hypothetical protein
MSIVHIAASRLRKDPLPFKSLYCRSKTTLWCDHRGNYSFTLVDKQLLSQPNTPPPILLSSFNELILIGRVVNPRPADLDPAGFGTFGCSDPDPKISQR